MAVNVALRDGFQPLQSGAFLTRPLIIGRVRRLFNVSNPCRAGHSSLAIARALAFGFAVTFPTPAERGIPH